jgi:hypothetical protein
LVINAAKPNLVKALKEKILKFRVYDDQPFREKRLEKALRIACAVMSVTEQQASMLIDSLEDFRGTLRIRWNSWPITDHQRAAFDAAWRECGEHCVEHIDIKNDVF